MTDAAVLESEAGDVPRNPGGRWPGRFTPADGWRGWLRACSTGAPVHGAGLMIVTAESITLRGFQRSWLGAQVEADVTARIDRVRNVASDGSLVHLEVRIGRRWRAVDFVAEDDTMARAIVAALPGIRTSRFLESWQAFLEFERLLRTREGKDWIALALVLTNLLVFVAACLHSHAIFPGLQTLLRFGANSGLLTTQGEWWRWIASIFLHFSILHLLLNMWTLWNAGRLVERLFGGATFATVYLAGGLLASMASTVWNPAAVSAGASGAIFAVLGFLLGFTLRGSGIPAPVLRAHRWSTAAFVGFNLLLGAVSIGVDNAAHVGGLLAGLGASLVLARPRTDQARAALAPAPLVSVIAIAAVLLVVGAAYVRAPQGGPPTLTDWGRDNAWYGDGEQLALGKEMQLRIDWAAGRLSPEELAKRLRRDVIPFFEDAAKRIAVQRQQAGPNGDGPMRLIEDFVTSHRDSLEAWIATAEGSGEAGEEQFQTASRRVAQARARISLAQMRVQWDGQRATGLRHALLDAWQSQRARRDFECVEPPATWHFAATAEDAPGDGPALRRALSCEAQRLFLSGDFRELDAKLAATFGQLRDQPDGGSSFTGLIAGLDDLFEYQPDATEQHMIRVAEWRRERPQSVYPWLAEAALFQQWAWSARGSGFASSVSQQQWDAFHFRTQLARASLEDSQDVAGVHPRWHELSIEVGVSESAPVEQLLETFELGQRIGRDYDALTAAMLRALLPRWLGSTRESIEFINRVSLSLPNDEYARLVWRYSRYEADTKDLFADGRVSWTRVVDGLERLVHDHPQSDYWVNAYANLACRKGDAEAFHRVRPRLEGRLSSTAWSSFVTLDGCDRTFGDDTTGAAGLHDAQDEARAQVAAALAAAEPVRQAIIRYVEINGALPSDEILRSDPAYRPASPDGSQVQLGPGASIDMKLVGGVLDGKSLSWFPTVEPDGGVRWWCAQQTVPERLLGPPCR